MNKTPANIQKFVNELEDVARSFADYHKAMETYYSFYKHSAFRGPRPGEAPMPKNLKVNYLKKFARANMQYISQLPTMNVPTAGGSQEQRLAAAGREKFVNDAWRRSGGSRLAKKWSFDGTVRSVAISEVCADIPNKRIYVRRHNPLKCFWQISDTNGEFSVLTFWAVSLMTRDQCQKKYNKTPTSDPLGMQLSKDSKFRKLDGKEWFADVIRWDGQTRTRFVGNVEVEPQHNHMFGEIPVDACFPFDDDEENGNRGAFYLEDLVDLQAEFHDTIHRRASIVRRMSNPAVWARGIVQGKEFDNFTKAMQNGNGGGFLQLSTNGDVGILQLNETKMLDNHKAEVLEDMTRLAGFNPSSAFGEVAGANTSGDAANMYFTPTQKFIDDQNINWVAFYQSINAKILRGYEKLLVGGKTVRVTGSAPRSTIVTTEDEDGKQYKGMSSRLYDEEIGADVIQGNYATQAVPASVTPKNDILDKRFWMEATKNGFVSKTTGYERIGIDSPEEELELLRQEQGDPLLNPQGTTQLLSAMNSMNPPAPTLPQPTPGV